MLAGHRQMIKQLRGVPGVTSEKMVEGNYQNSHTFIKSLPWRLYITKVINKNFKNICYWLWFLIKVKANNPIHCALSLVGEPIMYPHINEFVDYLHDKGISTYLVTNAQFPDAIATLPPITQVNHTWNKYTSTPYINPYKYKRRSSGWYSYILF